ncbi:hypothetical protein ACLOFA_00845 [Limosilactobacillus mucosae]|uniref:hypothetical protein n=1 Tax=Limosilactobacillus mucosae TaxID=97478 RepID=UPI003EB899B5
MARLCSNCGRKTHLFTRTKFKDGILCSKCLKTFSIPDTVGFRLWAKNNSYQAVTRYKQAANTSETKTNHINNKREIPNPKIDLSEIKRYLKEFPDCESKGDKRFNKRTGYPLAKQSSIERSRNALVDMLSLTSDNYYAEAHYSNKIAIDNYLLSIELPFFHAGIVAYKQGDWDIAEKLWLSVLDIRPTNVLRKLEIMYRKQQRYKDIVKLYKIAQPLVRQYDSLTGENTYKFYKTVAILNDEQHKKEDHSVGVIRYPSKIDSNYLRLLRTAR